MNSTLESIQLFYHVILSLTLLMCCSIVFSFWYRKQTPNGASKNGILFSGLILLTWALSSMGHLFSKLFPEAGRDANLLASIFRVMSLFNNLFLFLVLPYLGLFRRFRNDRINFNISIIAIIIVMLSFILDRVSIHENNIGKLVVAFIDTILSAPIIVLFGYGLNRYCKQAYPKIGVLIVYNTLAVSILFLVILGSMAMPLFNLFENEAIVSNFHIVYFIHYPALFYLTVIIFMISYRMYSQVDQVFGFTGGSVSSQSEDASSDLPYSGLSELSNQDEISPKSIHFDYQSDKQQFQLALKCQVNEQETIYRWSGNNCTYPYFYWLYLSVALMHHIEVEIKDSQVSRNRMLRMLNKHLSPRFFIQLNGSVASLNMPVEQIFISPALFHHNAVKSKFKESIDPFLVLTTCDLKKYGQDWSYRDEIFERVYKLLF